MNIDDLLISAIQSQQMVDIQFRKETDQDLVIREVAPYDIYDKQDKNGNIREVLLGYCWEHKNYKESPIIVYLDTICDIRLLNIHFNGIEVKRLISPKNSPQIMRNW